MVLDDRFVDTFHYNYEVVEIYEKSLSRTKFLRNFKKRAYPHATFSKHKLSDFENKLLTDGIPKHFFEK